MPPQIRPAAVAGTFYPAPPAVLAREVRTLLAQASVAEADAAAPKALVVPHAGYMYSGAVAATAYARLQRWRERFRRVVLLGPVHRVPVRGLALPGVQAFATPLGRVPVDADAVAALADLPQVVQSPAAHAWEHALEVQLPFLQAVLSEGFTLVPLAVGDASAEEVAQVLERLWGGAETLIIVSSDLSHDHAYAQAQRIDAEAVRTMLELQPMLDHEQACGATPLNGLLLAARHHRLQPELLDLRNSGDTAGDRSRVVGYAALSFTEPDHGQSRAVA
jgi:AmmeMemoRadiSam system protein B